jgi:hypothetical protein
VRKCGQRTKGRVDQGPRRPREGGPEFAGGVRRSGGQAGPGGLRASDQEASSVGDAEPDSPCALNAW